jgi:hypothetical protein
MPRIHHSWGLVGLCGAALMAYGATYLDAHPLLQWLLLGTAASGFLSGILMVLWTLITWVWQLFVRPRSVRRLFQFGPWDRQIPLRRALQIAYEQCESTVVGQYIDRAYQESEERPSYLYHSLGIHNVPLFARRPPSSQSRRISETHKELMLMPGTSDLAEVTSHKKPVFKDASVRRADLWRVVRHLRQLDPG